MAIRVLGKPPLIPQFPASDDAAAQRFPGIVNVPGDARKAAWAGSSEKRPPEREFHGLLAATDARHRDRDRAGVEAALRILAPKEPPEDDSPDLAPAASANYSPVPLVAPPAAASPTSAGLRNSQEFKQALDSDQRPWSGQALAGTERTVAARGPDIGSLMVAQALLDPTLVQQTLTGALDWDPMFGNGEATALPMRAQGSTGTAPATGFPQIVNIDPGNNPDREVSVEPARPAAKTHLAPDGRPAVSAHSQVESSAKPAVTSNLTVDSIQLAALDAEPAALAVVGAPGDPDPPDEPTVAPDAAKFQFERWNASMSGDEPQRSGDRATLARVHREFAKAARTRRIEQLSAALGGRPDSALAHWNEPLHAAPPATPVIGPHDAAAWKPGDEHNVSPSRLESAEASGSSTQDQAARHGWTLPRGTSPEATDHSVRDSQLPAEVARFTLIPRPAGSWIAPNADSLSIGIFIEKGFRNSSLDGPEPGPANGLPSKRSPTPDDSRPGYLVNRSCEADVNVGEAQPERVLGGAEGISARQQEPAPSRSRLRFASPLRFASDKLQEIGPEAGPAEIASATRSTERTNIPGIAGNMELAEKAPPAPGSRPVPDSGPDGGSSIRPPSPPQPAGAALAYPAPQAGQPRGDAIKQPGHADGTSAPRPAQAENAVELAQLLQRSGGRQMNIVVRDYALGRVSLHFAERAGAVQTVIRSDSEHGARVITESLPALLQSLSERGMPASFNSPGYSSGDPGADSQSSSFDQRFGQGRHARPGSRGTRRGGRASQVFRLAAR